MDIFEVGDLANIQNAMIYQDLSIGFLMKCKRDDPEAFKLSGFENLSTSQLEIRNKIQLERYKNAKYIFTMSQALRNYLVEEEGLSAEKVIHVGGGINVDKSVDRVSVLKKNRRNILFVGRDFYRKGGDVVVEAFKILKTKKEYKNLKLYIAGPQDIDERFKVEGVEFLGDITNDELDKYFRMCDIFCMPSKFEAYGLVFAEALTYGLPCIGLNKFEMPYFIQHGTNGYLLNDSNDSVELAVRIIELLNNETIFKYVESKQRDYRKQYSWDTVAERIMSKIDIR